jgi:superfamily I DNA and/or RNA helicase
MRGTLDYLFVDEAGQVSVANLIGMAPAAQNFVLIGDQMQLGQPTQGFHPGESGLSLLDYLLQGKATIPEEIGVFLGTTWRLHPRVCDFISGAVYEGLQPAPHTQHRVVRVPPTARHLTREAGILFVPVPHEGNTQGSEEEVAVIRELVDELVGGEVTSEQGQVARRLQLEDMLFVAPYNMQVRKLSRALGPRARVRSVDKFQGQEAPVVILSMCASHGEGSPRGLEFLLNKNRLNMPLSRAQSLAIVVANPALAQTRCQSLSHMTLLNLFCRVMLEGGRVGRMPTWGERVLLA